MQPSWDGIELEGRPFVYSCLVRVQPSLGQCPVRCSAILHKHGRAVRGAPDVPLGNLPQLNVGVPRCEDVRCLGLVVS